MRRKVSNFVYKIRICNNFEVLFFLQKKNKNYCFIRREKKVKEKEKNKEIWTGK